MLAETIHRRFDELMPVSSPDLAIRSTLVPVPLQDFSAAKVARSHATIVRNQRSELGKFPEAWKILNVDRYRRKYGDNLPMEVDVIRVGKDTSIVALPHEIFVELGLAIKHASPFKHTIVITLANDLDTYIPTRKAFAEGNYYEITASVIKPGGGEMLVAAATHLLQDLKP